MTNGTRTIGYLSMLICVYTPLGAPPGCALPSVGRTDTLGALDPLQDTRRGERREYGVPDGARGVCGSIKKDFNRPVKAAIEVFSFSIVRELSLQGVELLLQAGGGILIGRQFLTLFLHHRGGSALGKRA
jgi:hypothetical protein